MNIIEQNGYTIIQFPSIMPENAIDQIESTISPIIKREGIIVLIDMQNIANLYSSMVGLTIHLHKAISKNKGKLYIVNVNEGIEQSLRSANLDKTITIYSTMVDFEIERDTT